MFMEKVEVLQNRNIIHTKEQMRFLDKWMQELCDETI